MSLDNQHQGKRGIGLNGIKRDAFKTDRIKMQLSLNVFELDAIYSSADEPPIKKNYLLSL